MKTEEYTSQKMELSGIPIRINSYKIGDRFYCHVENTDPGATIARADAASREEAVQAALAKAKERLK
ncbi:MAG: hypothetical protein HW412_373 [Bacteroidetes bacterium]|nr:hypothetical protein [Bacteroidota bacterium]